VGIFCLGFHKMPIGFIQLHKTRGIGNHYRVCFFNGILEEFCIDDGLYLFNRRHTGGFDNDPLGFEGADDVQHLGSEIGLKGTADTAAWHFHDIFALMCQQVTVNPHFSEFIDQHNRFFITSQFPEGVYDKRGFTDT